MQRETIYDDRRRLLGGLGGAAVCAVIGPGNAGEEKSEMGNEQNRRQTKAPIKLFLCGDVMTGRGIDQILPQPSNPRLYEPYVRDARDYVDLAEQANGRIARPVDPGYIWGDALEELTRQEPDLRIVNLETAVTGHWKPWPKGINYRMHPHNIDCLTAAGIDCCVLANNHVLDWDYEGLQETTTILDAASIQHAGAGHDLAAAQKPAMLPLPRGGRVLVFAYGAESSGIGPDWQARSDRPGVNLLDELTKETVSKIASQVREIKQPGDVVVASIHWGPNWGYAVPPEQRAFAHRLIEAAQVDVVHGHSSHHVKGIEVFQDRLILYGCGDFLNDYEGIGGHEKYRSDLGLMYFPSLDSEDGRLQRLQLIPTRIRRLKVNRASAGEAEWLAAVLNREGGVFGTRVSLDGKQCLELDLADYAFSRRTESF